MHPSDPTTADSNQTSAATTVKSVKNARPKLVSMDTRSNPVMTSLSALQSSAASRFNVWLHKPEWDEAQRRLKGGPGRIINPRFTLDESLIQHFIEVSDKKEKPEETDTV